MEGKAPSMPRGCRSHREMCELRAWREAAGSGLQETNNTSPFQQKT